MPSHSIITILIKLFDTVTKSKSYQDSTILLLFIEEAITVIQYRWMKNKQFSVTAAIYIQLLIYHM